MHYFLLLQLLLDSFFFFDFFSNLLFLSLVIEDLEMGQDI